MVPIAVLTLVGLGLVADAGIGQVAWPPPGDGTGPPVAVPSPPAGIPSLLPPVGDEAPGDPPRAPRGAWWHGARVPIPYQRHVWYPTWDTPLRLLVGHPPQGIPAWEVPQRPAAPAYWQPLDN